MEKKVNNKKISKIVSRNKLRKKSLKKTSKRKNRLRKSRNRISKKKIRTRSKRKSRRKMKKIVLKKRLRGGAATKNEEDDGGAADTTLNDADIKDFLHAVACMKGEFGKDNIDKWFDTYGREYVVENKFNITTFKKLLEEYSSDNEDLVNIMYKFFKEIGLQPLNKEKGAANDKGET